MYLIWQARRSGRTLQLVETAAQINQAMPAHVVGRITALLNESGKPVRGSQVLVLGVSYKPNVTDSRESSAVPVVERLRRLHADVRWHDPLVGEDAGPPAPRLAELTGDVVAGADLVLLHTPHADYLRSPLLPEARLLLDAHGALRHRSLPNVAQL
jgi:UDP-N-acetyl-D-mannosaminuronate dehydrogenase